MADIPAGRQLSSWKEIAAYLGTSVRTAQNWERTRGLPVHRLPGGRAGVYALPEELDRWRTTGEAPRRPWWWWAAAAGFVLAGALAGYWLLRPRPGPPAYLRVDGTALMVRDAAGREVFRKHSPELLGGAWDTSEPEGRRASFAQLDDDPGIETLYPAWTANLRVTGTLLYCFSERGNVKWTFNPGKAVADREVTYSDVYFIEETAVFRPRGGEARVVVASHHEAYYPAQVAILDGKGKLLAEYWHSGHLPQLAMADLDGDGADEILLGGISNSYRAGTLVVLDSRDVSGASVEPQGDPRQLRGFQPAREKARILFPRTCINRALHEYNWVSAIDIQADTIRIHLTEHWPTREPYVTHYHLDRKLRLVHFEYSDALRSLHRQMRDAGTLDHDLTPAEEARMRELRFTASSPATASR